MNAILHKKKGVPWHWKNFTPFQYARATRAFRFIVLPVIKDAFIIALGIGCAAFGLKGFLLPNGFVDGGATGIALLCTKKIGLPLPVFLILINIPFVILGNKVMGRVFAIKTGIAICGLAAATAIISFPEITHDKLLVSVFGGFFLGAGIGLAVRGGAVIDGTEVLALFLSRKLGTTMGEIIVMINIIILGVAAYLLSLEIALYSFITYLAASKTVDFIIEGIEEYMGVTIISMKSDQIRKMIIEKLGRGITVYKGKRGFGKSGHTRDIDILYTVITRLEISKLHNEMEKIDPDAFVVMSTVKDTRGGMIKKRRLH